MKKAFFLIVSLIVFLQTLCAASYKYDYYKTTVEVGRNAVDTVREDFVANFSVPSHGLYRFIPYKYDNVNARINNITCTENFEKETKNGYVVLKIGSVDRTVIGQTPYELKYQYDTGPDIEEDCDVFYFNLLGCDNDCFTDQFDFEVRLPSSNLETDDFDVYVSYGFYGSESKLPFSISKSDVFYIITGSVANLYPQAGVTIRIILPEGWYEGTRQLIDFRGLFNLLSPAISIVLILLSIIVILTRSHAVTVITARYEAPRGLSPMLVGYAVDKRVDNKDLTSMIFYWADKGYLRIEEPKKNSYAFVKLGNLPLSVPDMEKKLFNGLFSGCDSNNRITVSQLQENRFFEVMTNVRIGIHRFFSGERALNSKKSVSLSVLFSIISIIPVLFYFLSYTACELCKDSLIFGVVISIVFTLLENLVLIGLISKWHIRKSNIFSVLFSALGIVLLGFVLLVFAIAIGYQVNLTLFILAVLSSLMTALIGRIVIKRTEYGFKLNEEILGFREFIDKVSMDELKTIIDNDPEVYYHILSYAIVLGLEQKWARKFESLAFGSPSWYVGVSPFDFYFYSHFAGRLCSTVATSVIPVQRTQNIGGGGIHFGGFSGGGFGGGGSRAW